MRFSSYDRDIVILGIGAIAITALFILLLVVPPLIFGGNGPVVEKLPLTFIRLFLTISILVTLFGVSPLLIYQFRRTLRLQDAINHYIKNKMQEIVLAVDLVETNLVKDDTSTELTYEEKVEMLNEVRTICMDVSGNLADTILREAPKFKRNIAATISKKTEEKEEGGKRRS